MPLQCWLFQVLACPDLSPGVVLAQVTPHNSPGASGQLLAQPWQPQQQPHEQQQQQLQPWQQQQQQQQQQGTLVQPFDNAADHSQEDDGQYRGRGTAQELVSTAGV